MGVPQVSKQIEGNVLCQDLGRLGAPTVLEPEYAVNQIEGNDVLRHMNNQGTISYLFMLLLCIKPATYAKNDAAERKGEFRFLSLLPYSSGKRRYRLFIEYVVIKR